MATATNRRTVKQLNAIVAAHVAADTAGHPACRAAIATLNARAHAAESAKLDAYAAQGITNFTDAGKPVRCTCTRTMAQVASHANPHAPAGCTTCGGVIATAKNFAKLVK